MFLLKTIRKHGIRWMKYLLFGLAGMAIVIVSTPDLRSVVNKHVKPEFRQVLSTARGDVFGQGNIAQIVKIKTDEGLFVEVYQKDDSSLKLIEKIKVQHLHDGYFMFNGEASNLVLDDVDGDQAVEILVPSFDENLVAHLNIYSFNKSRNSFVKLN